MVEFYTFIIIIIALISNHNHLITESIANPKVPLNIFTPRQKLVQTGLPSLFLFNASRPQLLIVKFIYACLMANWKPNLQNYGTFYASWHKHLKEMPPHFRQFVVEPINNATGRQVITAPTVTHVTRPSTLDALRSPVSFTNRQPHLLIAAGLTGSGSGFVSATHLNRFQSGCG